MNQTFAWTDERIATLRELWADKHLSAALIAERMGAPTKNVVLGKVHRLGLSKPRPPRAPKAPRVARRAPFFADGVRKPPSLPTAPSPPTAPSRPPPVGILQLRNESCRFAIGERAPFMFCGAPEADAAHGVSWCRYHARIVYRRGEREEAA